MVNPRHNYTDPHNLKNYIFIGICLLAMFTAGGISGILEGKLEMPFYHSITLCVFVFGALLIGIIIGSDLQYTADKRKLEQN